jgi:ubiquinol-cytochrome c reductase cytochrome c1 subunit
MRYNRLTDLGLNEAQIKDNLLFTGTKVGDTMRIAMAPADAKAWFGALPPDLSVNARARASGSGSGADWLYTYLRSFYRDSTRATGWNNSIFPNVGMPHVLWELQGKQRKTEEGFVIQEHERGRLSEAEYDRAILDITAFLTYVGEPARLQRESLGVWVILFLSFFTLLAYLLKQEYWKDIH